jgi:NAD-dependent dihydropyrimidine dehydrogenase PreA subunit
MGLAVIEKKKCVDYQDKNHIMCWTCYERCPMKAKAIILRGGYLPEITDACVGCGVCEYVCPAKAVFVIPTRFRNEAAL